MSQNKKNKLVVAIVGATGAVGREVLDVFAKRNFPIEKIVPFASESSKGKEIQYLDQKYECRVLSRGCFTGVDLVFFDVSDELSKKWVPEAASHAWVIDNSATYRMDPRVPLIVPEVNRELLVDKIKQAQDSSDSIHKIISGPNCTVAPMVVALKPLMKWGIKRIVVSTYQSTSGGGTEAMQELKNQTLSVLQSESFEPKVFPHQIAFNCIPQIGGFKDDLYTSEEHKTVNESRKILNLPDLQMTTTAVRVPTLRCHSEALNIEFDHGFKDEKEILDALQNQEGLTIIDQPQDSLYPLAEAHPGDKVQAAGGADSVFVGRVRRDTTVKNGINLWIVSDNLRKGAALNGVQIAESLYQYSAF